MALSDDEKRAYQRDAQRRYRANHTPEKKAEIAQKKREYRTKNLDRIKAYSKAYDATHTRRRRKYETNRVSLLRWKYDLNVDQVEFLTAVNDEKCWVCDRPAGNRKLCIDHVATEEGPEVRGILCWHCNVVLGLVKDSPEILTLLSLYLTRDIPEKFLVALKALRDN